MPESKAVRRVADAQTLQRHQRLRSHQALIVLLLASGISAGMSLGAFLGVLEGRHVLAWSIGTLSGMLCFNVVIRCGWNLRLSSDPSLTMPQSVFSVFATGAAYVLFPPIRGIALLALAVTIAFGIFGLKPRAVRAFGAFTLAALGVTMAVAATVAPHLFPPNLELLHFVGLVMLVSTLSLLSARLGALRRKLRDQRDQLEAAMLRNRLLATQDELTALPNRRHMVELLDEELRRGGDAPSVALLDIDFFKQINDTRGHAGGDAVLQAFAATVRGALRERDVVARWGGEEFLVMLPHTTPAGAQVVIDRVRAAVAAAPVALEGARLQVRFSAGIARHASGDTASHTIGRADAALYAAKSRGRDCSVVDAAAPAPAPVSVPAAVS